MFVDVIEIVFMQHELSEAEAGALTHINPRRFALLLRAAKLGKPFTASQLKTAAPMHSSSLTRDLNSLEAAGLLIATPKASEPRQGRPVHFEVAPNAVDTFQSLHEKLLEASKHQQSS